MAPHQFEDSQNKNHNKKSHKVSKMSKINRNWIYVIIVVVFVILIAITFFNKNVAIKTTKQEFITKMLLAHDVEKVVIVNKTNVEIYLKKEVLKNEKYKELSSRSILREDVDPQYYFEIGDVSSFETDMREKQKDFPMNDQIAIEYVNQNSFLDSMISYLIGFSPVLLLIVVYFFKMKRLSGRSSIGGSSLLNNSKSRAKNNSNMWICKKCNKEIEDNFDVCWNCGFKKNISSQGAEFDNEKSEQFSWSETNSEKIDESVNKHQIHQFQNIPNKNIGTNKYKVVPFNRAEDVSSALQLIIDREAANGWKYINHQYSDKLKPGSAGCFGYGATPSSTIHIGLVIFYKE